MRWLFGISVFLLLANANTQTSAQVPGNDVLSQQKEALSVIEKFADGFCKVVTESGKSTSIEV
jgi:hypothetical protein